MENNFIIKFKYFCSYCKGAISMNSGGNDRFVEETVTKAIKADKDFLQFNEAEKEFIAKINPNQTEEEKLKECWELGADADSGGEDGEQRIEGLEKATILLEKLFYGRK